MPRRRYKRQPRTGRRYVQRKRATVAGKKRRTTGRKRRKKTRA